MASQFLGRAIHDTTPLSSFLVPRIFTALPLGRPYCPSHLLCFTLQSFLSLLQQLHGPRLVSPSSLLPVSHFSTASTSSLISANIGDHTLHLTIQITSWRRTVQGILLSSKLYLPLLPLVVLPFCCLFLPYSSSNSLSKSPAFYRFSLLSQVSPFAVNPFHRTKNLSFSLTFLLFSIFFTSYSSSPSMATGCGFSFLWPSTWSTYHLIRLTLTTGCILTEAV